MYEPSELERLHFTDADVEIKSTDMPERFQLRRIPVIPAEGGELDEEAEWIFKMVEQLIVLGRRTQCCFSVTWNLEQKENQCKEWGYLFVKAHVPRSTSGKTWLN